MPVLLYESGVEGGQNYIGVFSCDFYSNTFLTGSALVQTFWNFHKQVMKHQLVIISGE